MGRPSDYSPEVAEAICTRLAEGESMRAICRDEGMPERSTVDRWREADKDFDARCARAREDQAEKHHDEMDDIEERVLSGDLDPKAANVVLANKRWRMEKLKPKVYGQAQRVDANVNHSGSVGFVLNVHDTPKPRGDA